jgi:hypothetical protein
MKHLDERKEATCNLMYIIEIRSFLMSYVKSSVLPTHTKNSEVINVVLFLL